MPAPSRPAPLWALLPVVGLCGCAGDAVRYQSAEFPADVPVSVAVLPFDNESMSFAASDILRALVNERLADYGYEVRPAAQVDERLRALGVTDGGQLGAYEPRAIGTALEADGLMYGSVEEFVYQNVGFLRKRTVSLRLKLVDARRGVRLWEDVGTESSVKVALSKEKAGRSFIEGVIEQASEQLFRVPLQRESQLAVGRVLRKYPRRY